MSLRDRHLPIVLFAAAATVAACSSSSSSGPNPGQGGGSLPAQFAVFVSDVDVQGSFDAKLVDLETDAVRSLTAPLSAWGELIEYGTRLSSDGAVLAVSTRNGSIVRFHLVDVASGGVTTLPMSSNGSNGALRGGPNPPQYQFSPDGERLLVTFANDGYRPFRTFAMRPDGSGAVEIASGTYETTVAGWLPDSSAFVALVTDDTTGDTRVVVVDATTLARRTVGPDLGAGMDVERVEVSADGTTLAYIVEYDTSPTNEETAVVGVDIATGAFSTFTGLIEEPDEDLFELADDGSGVAFVTEHTATEPETVWIGDLTTGQLVLAGGAGASVSSRVREIEWEPGGRRLAYLADHRTENLDEAFVTDASGQSVPVEPSTLVDTDVELMEWSPNGGLLAFVRDEAGSHDEQLYLYDATSPLPPELVPPTGAGDSIEAFVWSPDGAWIYGREDRAGSAHHVIAFRTSDPSDARDLGGGWEGNAAPGGSEGAWNHFVASTSATGGSDAIWRREAATGNRYEVAVGSPDDPAGTRRISPLGGPTGGDDIRHLYLR